MNCAVSRNVGLAAVRYCAVEGCGGEAARNSRWCLRCREEIEALEIWQHQQQIRELLEELRRQERRERFARALRRIRALLWVPELIFLGCAVAWLELVYGAALWQWLRQGGR